MTRESLLQTHEFTVTRTTASLQEGTIGAHWLSSQTRLHLPGGCALLYNPSSLLCAHVNDSPRRRPHAQEADASVSATGLQQVLTSQFGGTYVCVSWSSTKTDQWLAVVCNNKTNLKQRKAQAQRDQHEVSPLSFLFHNNASGTERAVKQTPQYSRRRLGTIYLNVSSPPRYPGSRTMLDIR